MKIAELCQSVTKGSSTNWSKATPRGSSLGRLERLSGSCPRTQSPAGYHGINIPILWDAASRKGYERHAWLTFKQPSTIGRPSVGASVERTSSSRSALRSAEVAIAPDLFPFAGEAAKGGVLGERADLAQQHRVAGQAEDVPDAPALAPRHRLGPSVMTVATHRAISTAGQQARMRPMTGRSTSATSAPSGVLPGAGSSATGLPVVAS